MAPHELWGEDFIDGVDTWQAEQAMFVTHIATSEAPKFAVQGGTLSPVEAGILVSPERALRFGYDDQSGAANKDHPPLQIICPTAAGPPPPPSGMPPIKIFCLPPIPPQE